MYRKLPCVIMRGGTSKSLVFAAHDLPADPLARDATILAAFGSPDVRQIDGLGGADPLTSKLAIVAPAERADADVDYTFGQVGIANAEINYGVSCGNTAAAVGVYAVEQGLVAPAEGSTSVRIFNTNSGKIIVAEVPTRAGAVVTEGDFRINGVPKPGAEIRLKFLEPAGGVTGRLLPGEAAVNEITVTDGRRFRFSLVDCGNLYAILHAADLGLSGPEHPGEIEARPGLKVLVEELRTAIAERFLTEVAPAGRRAPKLKMAVVGPAVTHISADGVEIAAEAIDVVARVINQERVHKAFAVTGAICFAAAASVPGTIVQALAAGRPAGRTSLRLGHPQGVIEPDIELGDDAAGLAIESVQIGRTARRIMDGNVYVPAL